MTDIGLTEESMKDAYALAAHQDGIAKDLQSRADALARANLTQQADNLRRLANVHVWAADLIRYGIAAAIKDSKDKAA